MRVLLWLLFAVSLVTLLLLFVRNKYALHVVGKIAMIGVVSVLLLYAVNWIGAIYSFHLPINSATVATVGLLGLPGLALVTAVQFFIL